MDTWCFKTERTRYNVLKVSFSFQEEKGTFSCQWTIQVLMHVYTHMYIYLVSHVLASQDNQTTAQHKKKITKVMFVVSTMLHVVYSVWHTVGSIIVLSMYRFYFKVLWEFGRHVCMHFCPGTPIFYPPRLLSCMINNAKYTLHPSRWKVVTTSRASKTMNLVDMD